METKTSSHAPAPASLSGTVTTLRLTGWISFWIQLTLVLFSSLSLLFAGTGREFAAEENRGIGIGIFWAVCGILALCFGIYIAFRYTRTAKQLQNAPAERRPHKSDTLRLFRIGLVAGLVGIFLALLGAGATVGVLVAKVVSQPPGVAIVDPNKIVRALDVLVVVANLNCIAAHFVGAVTSLWLWDRIHR